MQELFASDFKLDHHARGLLPRGAIARHNGGAGAGGDHLLASRYPGEHGPDQ